MIVTSFQVIGSGCACMTRIHVVRMFVRSLEAATYLSSVVRIRLVRV